MSAGVSCPQNAYTSEAKPLGVMEQLHKRKAELESVLEEVESTIELFKKMPEMEQYLTRNAISLINLLEAACQTMSIL